MTIIGCTYKSLAEFVSRQSKGSQHNAHFQRIFNVHSLDAACRTTPELQMKYQVDIENVQNVIAVENLITSDVAFFNPSRKLKPQNFSKSASSPALLDPTENGNRCDFCKWQQFTATDQFGRVDRTHAVTASNLFKYGAPYQGVILFKHHDPLVFSLPQLTDLLLVADEWFLEASTHYNTHTAVPSDATTNTNKNNKNKLYPLFVWNALSRAGASQFHGHAQVMLSAVDFPTQIREKKAIQQYKATYHGAAYYEDLVAAHDAAGLVRWMNLELPSENNDDNCGGEGIEKEEGFVSSCRSVAFPSLCPYKDSEIVILGSSLKSEAFQKMFYIALRTLIDELGHQTFNAGIYNIDIDDSAGSSEGVVVAKVVARGKLSSAASDFGGLEVFSGASIGHTDPFIVKEAFDRVFLLHEKKLESKS